MSSAASADRIAEVVRDLRDGLVRPLKSDAAARRVRALALPQAGAGPIIDATAIYESLVEQDRPVWVYEDHPCIAPPWSNASICYVNHHGNVIVMALAASEWDQGRRAQWTAEELAQLNDAALGKIRAPVGAPSPPRGVLSPEGRRSGAWETTNEVDWTRVRWLLNTFVWLGGSSPELGGRFPTTGPAHLWQFAIYDDGEPADLHWVQIVEEYPLEHWDMAHLVLLGALNFVNCRNIEVVEPRRPRGQARRLARHGTPISTIVVRPIGRSSRSGSPSSSEQGTQPLTSVRGHFASYGPRYHRGLLFGRHEGRFWIPQHARGSAEHGQTEQRFSLEPESHA